jgi:FkbM family methyltransferase
MSPSDGTTARMQRLIRHFREGTWGARALWEIHKWQEAVKQHAGRLAVERRRRQWDRLQERCHYADVNVEGGARLRLNGDSALAFLIFCGRFERNEQTFLWRYLRPGDLFVDIGANIGLFTVIAATRVTQRGTVYAFEPVMTARRRLEENVQLNHLGNVHVEPFALSDQDGWLEILVPTDGWDAWSSLATPTAGRDIRKDRVETLTWDTFAKERGQLRPTMMKIDVEGWENRVLSGATATLSATDAPLLQVEFCDKAAHAARSSCALLYQHLLELGYTVCDYDRTHNRLRPEPLRSSYPYINLYATKHLHHDNDRLRRFPTDWLRPKLETALASSPTPASKPAGGN